MSEVPQLCCGVCLAVCPLCSIFPGLARGHPTAQTAAWCSEKFTLRKGDVFTLKGDFPPLISSGESKQDGTQLLGKAVYSVLCLGAVLLPLRKKGLLEPSPALFPVLP